MNKTAVKNSWSYAPRFRKGVFGWRSDPAIARLYNLILSAAEFTQCKDATLTQIRNMLEGFPQERLVKGTLARAAGLWDVDPAGCTGPQGRPDVPCLRGTKPKLPLRELA